MGREPEERRGEKGEKILPSFRRGFPWLVNMGYLHQLIHGGASSMGRDDSKSARGKRVGSCMEKQGGESSIGRGERHEEILKGKRRHATADSMLLCILLHHIEVKEELPQARGRSSIHARPSNFFQCKVCASANSR